jgi:hypothetical protein
MVELASYGIVTSSTRTWLLLSPRGMLLCLHDHAHAIAINAKFANQALQIESRAWERG